MPFLILGIIIFGAGFLLFRDARKRDDSNVAGGAMMLMVAGVILIILYGLFYRFVTVMN